MAEGSVPAKRKVPVASVAFILVLSLATYWFFNAQAMPLDKASIAVVVGFWTAAVLLVGWLRTLALAKRHGVGPGGKSKGANES